MTTLTKGTWSIEPGNDSDVVKRDTIIANVQETYMVEFPRGEAMRTGATSFDNAFDANCPEQAHYQALLQMMLMLVTSLRQNFATMRHGVSAAIVKSGSNDSPTVHDGEPIKCFFETLLGNTDLADESDRERAELSKDLPTLEDVSARSFMRNVPGTVPVVGYRLWITVHQLHHEINFGRMLFSTINELDSAYARRFGGYAATTSAPRGPDAQGDTGVSMSSYSGETGDKYGLSLGPLEKWKRIHSLGIWANICDMLIGIKRLRKPDQFERIVSAKTSVESNPANPRYALSPIHLFSFPNPRIDAAQTTIANYFTNDQCKALRFARPDCVVRVAVEDETISRFSAKMFPDYQLRSFSSTATRTTRRQRKREERFLQRHVLHGTNFPVRSMVHRPLAFGEAGDIDGGDDECDDGVVPIMSDAAKAMLFPGAVSDEVLARATSNVSVVGGTAASDIIAMNKSVPVVNGDGELELYDYMMLEREDFEDSTSLAAENLLSQTDTPSRSDFHMLRYQGANRRRALREAAVDPKIDRATLRTMYLVNQHDMMTCYDDLLMQPTSRCSKPGQRMNRWFAARVEEDRAWLGVNEPLRDPAMSTFGNMIARRMMRLESVMFVTTAHIMVLSMLFGTLDAYRHYFDLHWNAVMTGENSAGKSFVTKLVQMLRIHETVAKVDDETSRAAFVDTDHNDQITYTEEIKPDQFRDSAGGGNDTSEASLKEFLTSMVRTLKTFHKTPSGMRTQRVVYSQQITSMLGCSNLPAHKFSPAIRSRFSCYDCVFTQRPDRHTSDMQGVEKRLDDKMNEFRSTFIDEMCSEQYLHYHIEKLISTHALTDVTTTAFDTIQQLFTRYLKERHAIDVATRTIERAAYMLRQLVMTARCELLFSSPYSKHFQKPFNVHQLRDLDPLLYDDEEMACFALELHAHEIVDKRRPHLISLARTEFVEPAIARILADTTTDPELSMRAVYLMPSTRILRSRDGTDDDRGRGGPSGGGSFRSSNRYSRARTESFGAASADSMHSMMGDEIDEKMADRVYSELQMYAYVRIAYKYDVVAQRLAAASEASPLVLDENQCRTLLRDLSKQHIVSPRYRWNSRTHTVEADGMRPNVRIPALLYTYDSVFIACTLFESEDIIAEAIAHCRSKYTPDTRKYITGRIVAEDKPYALRTRVVEAGTGAGHSIIDYATQRTPSLIHAFPEMFNADEAPTIDAGRRKLTMHYDDMSRRARAKALFLDPDVDGAADGLCSVVPYEKFAREFIDDENEEEGGGTLARRYVSKRPISYPEDVFVSADDGAVAPYDTRLPELPKAVDQGDGGPPRKRRRRRSTRPASERLEAVVGSSDEMVDAPDEWL